MLFCLILLLKHLFEIEIFYKIINVFTVTFDQFNASLLNKSINFLKRKKERKKSCWDQTFKI